MEYIVTQNLKVEVSKFEAYFEVHRQAKEPIMVVGPTGVGKSLFLHIFRRLYQKSNNKNPIIQADCSHFTGADPRIARSELFGHEKDAFTGATKRKHGLVMQANGGALILEEVGELPPDVQAMLLTFVETGEFRSVGSEKVEKADVWIVAATNNESNLRPDLRYRFFPFYISPLHKRREDVLHYLAHEDPDLIRELRPWEILALLAYNWPGNVREIERLSKVFQIRTSGKIEGEWSRSPLSLYWQDSEFGSFNVFEVNELYFALKDHGVDVQFLDSLLNKKKVGLNSLNESRPFKSFKKLNRHKDQGLDIVYVELNALFADAMEGLDLYCHLLQQARWSSANLLNPAANALYKSELGTPPSPKKKYGTLRESINHYLTSAKKGEEEDIIITDMTFEELQKYYFTRLLALTGGNKTKAAKRAGIKKTTFVDRIKKLGIA